MKAFLDQGQDVPVARGFGIDDTVGMKASPQQTGREQIASGQAPQDRTFEASSDSGGEQGRASGELGSHPSLDHLVQSPARQSAHGKVIVEFGKPEGERLSLPVSAFQPRNPQP